MSQRPIMLGIVGDSAAGKTTITGGLVQLLGPHRVTHVCSDDYHKYDRQERARLGITALHPDCNYLDVLEQHLERLHHGQPILKPVYEHSNGTLVRPTYVQPKEFVIVEGLLGFHSPLMQQHYDAKVYLDPPEELRRVWKIRRDTSKRGYTAAQVEEELVKREADSARFIRPQRTYADIVVHFCPPSGTTPETAGPNLDARLVLRPTLPHPDLSYLIEEGQVDSSIRLLLGRDQGRPVDFLDIDGHVTPLQAQRLEDAIWKHIPDLRPVREEVFGDYQDLGQMRHSRPLALTQLLITYHLLRKLGSGRPLPAGPPTPAPEPMKG